MTTITIRELHMKTGDWVRKASRHKGIVVTDRKQPVARIVPFSEEEIGSTFSKRSLVKGFESIARRGGDSGRFISEDRDRA
jgi:antitoxin (DNA-binding transcriptional repressor) of toxin-antitoxin stability system